MPSSDSEDYYEELVQDDKMINWHKKTRVKKSPTKGDISRAAFKQNLLKSASVTSKKNLLQKMLGDPNKKVKELIESRLPKGILKHSPTKNESAVTNYKSNSVCEDTSDTDTQTKCSSISKNNSHNSENDNPKSKSNVQVPSESSGFESFTDSNERNVPNKNKLKRILNNNSGEETNGSSDGSTTASEERKTKNKALKRKRSEINHTGSSSYSEKDVPSRGNKNASKTSPKNSDKSKSRIIPRKQEELSPSGSESEQSVEKPKNVILLERDEKFSIGSQIRITPLKSEKIIPPSQKLLDRFMTENELNKTATKPEWLANLSSDDEIFSVQIPKSLQVQLLIDNLVPLNGQAKFKIEKDTYVWNASVEDDLPCVNLIAAVSTGNYVMKTVRPKGAIVVHRQFKIKHRPIELPLINDTVDVPHDLKLRHPLFGLNYEDQIRLDDKVIDKLNNVKRKKKRKHDEDNRDNLPKKKKKKRSKDASNEIDVLQEDTKHENKHESANDDNFDLFKLLDDYTLDRNLHKTKKKKKKERDVNILNTEPQNVINDNKALFIDDDLSQIINEDPSERKKKKKHTNDLSQIIEDPSERKKKKKRSKDVGDTCDVSQNIDELVDMNSHKKKKSKKEFFIANSTMMSPACTAYKADESGAHKERKKKKRKSKAKEENPDFLNFIDGLVREVDDITMNAKKKRRSDNDTGISNDSERKRKKKKKHSHME